MAKETLVLTDFTPEKIEELKAKHGGVFTIEVEDETVKYDPYRVPSDDDADLENAKLIYLRKPTDQELNFAMTKMPAFLEAGKVIVKSCFLGGDADVLSDGKMLNAAAMQAVELIEFRKAKLKKL